MEIENISIRARVAFGIECLEKLIKNEFESLDNWNTLLLNKLWDYTTTDNLGEWHYIMSEYIPFSVLEDIPFTKKGNEYITSKEHKKLKLIYENSSDKIRKCINLIFEIGTIDLYTSIENKSPRTVLLVEEIISILKSSNCDIPNFLKYKNYSIRTSNGWGIKFSKSDIGPLI